MGSLLSYFFLFVAGAEEEEREGERGRGKRWRKGDEKGGEQERVSFFFLLLSLSLSRKITITRQKQRLSYRNTVPLRMFLIVPLGDFHICFSLNSSTRASSGVIVAHLMPTPCLRIALAASMVTWSSVASRCGSPRS